MITKIDKNQERKKRHYRVRNKVSGTPSCPRLCVYRSLKSIYAQVIDDVNGKTLVSASTLEKELNDKLANKNKTQQAEFIGEVIAERALKANIKNVVFDRGGYLYTGRVAAVAEGARKAGLEF